MLVREPQIHLLIGGRNIARAQTLAVSIGLPLSDGVAIDARAPDLSQRFTELKINTVIHTAGPFQGQDYAVALAAIAACANYIDLADGRDFVAGIDKLHTLAQERGVLVTSGASSVPALSSAVVDQYRSHFSRLECIRVGISSGGRAPGIASMRGVFSYCGNPFLRLEKKAWVTTYGWQDLQRHQFPAPVGARFLGSCEVPDLTLLPIRHPEVHTVTFHAGFASSLGHLFLWAASQMVRLRLLSSLTPWVTPLHKLSQWLEPIFSDKGAMFVSMHGLDHNGQPMRRDWNLIAGSNHGPHIPCGAAVALAGKLARGEKLPTGAMSCMGLLTVADYIGALTGLDVHVED
jgi:saccharopine dehydrogenase-like NADP-dependent oxidoreductase